MYCKLRLGDQIKNYTNLQPYSFILDYMRKKMEGNGIVLCVILAPRIQNSIYRLTHLDFYMKLNLNVD